MKRKGNLILGKRNLVVVLLALMLIISSVLTACGTSTETTAPETKEEIVVGNDEEQAEVVETKQEKTVQETIADIEENTQEMETFQSTGEWAQSVDRTEPKMTIWNEITKEGIILENEQKYTLKEGDLLVICTKEKENGLSIDADLSLEDFKCSTSDNYVKIKFHKFFRKKFYLRLG